MRNLKLMFKDLELLPLEVSREQHKCFRQMFDTVSGCSLVQ